MSALNPLGFSTPRLSLHGGPNVERIVQQRPLRRVLAFLGYSIDDVINDPIARNEVLGYYKLYKQVERSCEITEMERAWNALGR